MPRSTLKVSACALAVAAALSIAPLAVRAESMISQELLQPQGVPWTLVQSVSALVSTDQFDEALRQIRDAQKHQAPSAELASLEGAVHLARRDLANARKSFERALALSQPPRNARAMFGLATVAAATGNAAEYASWLEKSIAADPMLQQPRLELVKLYIGQGQGQKALSAAQDLLARHPDSLVALDAVGLAQLASGQSDAALRTYTQLAQTQPNDAQIHYRRAMALDALHDYDRASVELRRALSLRPDYVDAQAMLSGTELRRGRSADALQLAREVQSAAPSVGVGWQLEGDALMAQRDYRGAQKSYEKAYGMHKTGALTVKLASAYAANGARPDGESLLQKWLGATPGDVETRTYLASTYAAERRYKEAIGQYQIVVQAEPNNAVVLNDLAWLYQQQKDSRALATAEQAYRLKPDSAQTADTLGWILVSEGNTTRALELLRKAVDLAPSDPSIRYHLAAALAKSGEATRARTELQQALRKSAPFLGRADAEALLAQLSK